MYRNNNNNQYFDYMQAGTASQDYQQQQQGWFQDQTYNQYYNRQQNYPSQHQQQQNVFNQYQQQNFRQQSSNKQQWNKKRPHEFVTASQNGSPEPKRQIQKRNSVENIQQQMSSNNQQYNNTKAAYQTVPYQKPFERITRTQLNKMKKGQQPIEHPVIKIQEERQKDWTAKMSLVLNLLSGCKAGEEIQLLISYLQPVRITWNKTKETIHNDLLKFLSPMGVEKALIFGSTLTGLDFHGSDLDFYVQLKSQPNSEDETRININKAAKLSRYLHTKEFMVICTIHNARVPLIRLLHKKSKVTCDVNFTSQFGYYNSYFIGHVVGYDRRIRDMAVILKLWSKTNKLTSQMIISNYCLIMLMIFYLQNLSTPMLDTIINIQRTRSPMILDKQKKWNFYFNDSINKSKNNHQSLRELLVGFFDYYSKLNTRENVVSLLTGRLIKREEFDTHPELEESRKLISSCGLPNLKSENADFFHVQDGFELNLNIGIKVKKHVEHFFELLKLTHQKCEELNDRPFAELLINLFTEVKINLAPLGNGSSEKKSKSKSKNKKRFEMIIHAVPGDLKV